MTEKVAIKKVDPEAKLPTYGSAEAAGADLYVLLDAPLVIAPGETALVRTGVAVALPPHTVGLVFARSGLATKRGVAPANKVGVIDSDYRGEIFVPLHNHSAHPVQIEPYERVAQLILLPYITADFVLSEELDGTVRGDRGFGSTGRQ